VKEGRLEMSVYSPESTAAQRLTHPRADKTFPQSQRRKDVN